MAFTTQYYIDRFTNAVIQATYKTGILPSIQMAQAILESGNGNSLLAKTYNNHFGIKADRSWRGLKINLPTKEVVNGQTITINQYFRWYNDPKESFKDHIQFLKENPRYTKAGVFRAKKPETQAQKLKDAGYATDPNYAAKLVSLIDQYDLRKLDQLAAKKKKEWSS